MNYLKQLLAVCFISTLCLFCFSSGSLAIDSIPGVNPSFINAEDKEVKLNDNTTLKIKVPTNWIMSKDPDGNFNFKYIYSDSPLTITIFNTIQPYKNDNELKTFVALHEKAVLKTINHNENIKTGLDTVFSITVPWMLLAEEKDNDIIFHKLMYPYDGKQAYVIMITYKGTSPIKESENMLSVILFSIFKQA